MISDYLIIPSLKTRASDFLVGSINASNCLALKSFASAVTYTCENFVAVTKSEDFSRLDEEKFKELICLDEINVSEEEREREQNIFMQDCCFSFKKKKLLSMQVL